MRGFAIEFNGTGGRTEGDLGDDVEERALAATVGSGDTKDLALHDVKADIVDRFETAKALGEAARRQDGCVHGIFQAK